MTGSVTYRVAPPGFSREQWREFTERGIVIIDGTTPIRRRTTSRSSWTGRVAGADTDAGVPERIPLRLRKRRTAAERFTTERRGGDR